MTTIVIPYRDRERHLTLFLAHMKRFLKLPHEIIIVEQANDLSFNRGMLLNIGFLNRSKDSSHVVMHDVDMLPLKTSCLSCGTGSGSGVDYSYERGAVHLAGKVSQFGYKMPYPTYFGGVTKFCNKTFELINGYSNDFWGWGAEDDDIYKRCISNGIKPKFKAFSFQSLYHRKGDMSNHENNLLKLKKGTITGLNDCHYSILSKENYNDAALIKVNFELK